MRIHLMSAAAVLVLCGAARAEKPAALEAAAGDVKTLVRDLRGEAGRSGGSIVAAGVTNIDMDYDCERFSYQENSPALSDIKVLMSRTWVEECDNISLPGGGGMCIPRRRVIFTDEKTVQLEIKDRQVPGPKETFEVCLRGQWLNFRTVSSPYKYDAKEKDGRYTLTRKK